MLAALDRAGAGDDDHLVASHRHGVTRGSDLDDRSIRHEVAGGELEGLQDSNALGDSRQRLEHSRVGDPAVVPDDADDRPLLSSREVRRETELLDPGFDSLDLRVGSAHLHHDDHAREDLRSLPPLRLGEGRGEGALLPLPPGEGRGEGVFPRAAECCVAGRSGRNNSPALPR